jgi:hypothetical protein
MLDQFIRSLNPAQVSELESLRVAAESGQGSPKEIKQKFVNLVQRVNETTNLQFSVGTLVKSFNEFFTTGSTTSGRSDKDLISELPYPLGLRLKLLLQENELRERDEPSPQFGFSICALHGLLLRFIATVFIQIYVIETGGKNLKVNTQITEALRSPTDGTWLDLAGSLNKLLQRLESHSVYEGLLSILDGKVSVGKKNQKFKAVSQELINFRNRLLHGEEITSDDLDISRDKIFALARAFQVLCDYRLVAFNDSDTFILAGEYPTKLRDSQWSCPDDDGTYLFVSESQSIPLYPLLSFRDELDGEKVSELFFLNSIGDSVPSYIAFRYMGSHGLDGQKLGTYDSFQKFMAKIPAPPQPRNPIIDFSTFAMDSARMFVGRDEVLSELGEFLEARDTPYGILKAYAGMGKTAFLANLYNHRNTKDFIPLKINQKIIWAFHFCAHFADRDQPVACFRSIIGQVGLQLKLNPADYFDDDIKKFREERLPEFFYRASKALTDDEQLVVVIDALDESDLDSDETISKFLPDFLPPGIRFIVSFRVDDTGENPVVEDSLGHLSDENQYQFKTANPLDGLTREDVVAFLEKLSADGKVQDQTAEKIWLTANTSQRGADPFFLRFVAQSIRDGRSDLRRPETLPASLEDAFDEFWLQLPDENNFLLHRILLTLALMFDLGDDEFFADYFNHHEVLSGRMLYPVDIAMARVRAGKLLRYSGDRYGLFHDRFRKFLIGDSEGG